ncbi:MAG: hypothetical protein AAGI52_17705 [Bacteroidota bacterium]
MLPKPMFRIEQLAAERMRDVGAAAGDTAVIAFTITREGRVLDPVVEQSASPECDAIAAEFLCGVEYSAAVNEFGRRFPIDWFERVPCSAAAP